MKRLLILAALVLGGCASLPPKCGVGSTFNNGVCVATDCRGLVDGCGPGRECRKQADGWHCVEVP